MTLRIGWFSSGRGEGSRKLLIAAAEAIRGGELDCEIAFVFCNRERGEHEATDGFLDLAASYSIPCLTLSSRRFRRECGGELSKPGQPLPVWRTDYDRQVAELIAQRPFDICLLAGYMLIFTPEMAGRYPFLNLHPAAPDGPTGTWQDVIWQLIDERAQRSGVMIHLATEELDKGPPVTSCGYSLRGPAFDELWKEIGDSTSAELREREGETLPLFREIRRHGAAREWPLVIATLRAVAEGQVVIEDQRVVDAQGGTLEGSLDLSAEVDTAAASLLQ